MAWILFILYLIVTSYLGYLGSKKTKDFSTFAIGDGNMSPIIVGITLAASTASAATFIVNPGFVYVHGLSAFMHLGVSVMAGIVFMLLIVSYRFRRIGKDNQAVTIPNWIGKRYQSKKFALYFAVINLLSFAFLVLLTGGISIVIQQLLGVSNVVALIITLVFVTSYVILGGTYAHVLTNMLQGSMMIAVSLLVIGSGIYLMMDQPEIWAEISTKDSSLLKWVNPDSNLYGDIFSIYISGFLIGVALVCQPHILTKALYVNSDRAVTKYISVFTIVYGIFTCLLLAGFWAIITVPADQLMDSSNGAFRQDLVMTQYLYHSFPDWLFTICSVVLLAAAMSTLDGLMVGLSTITANDFWLNLNTSRVEKLPLEDRYKEAYRVSHIVLIILAICTFLVTLNPPKLLGIFGQFGVYALVITSLSPLINGIFFQKPNLSLVWASSIMALIIYVLLYFKGADWFGNVTQFANPAVPAAFVILITTVPTYLIQSVLSNQKHTIHA